MSHVESVKSPVDSMLGAAGGAISITLKARLRWHLRQWLRILGWPGTLAVALLVMYPVAYFSGMRPLEVRLNDAQRSAEALRVQAAQGKNVAKASLLTPSQQLAEFYRAFPSERYSPQWLEKLVAIAELNDLSLNEGDYKMSREKFGQLVRYQITLPVTGQYPQIREFLAQIPKELPIMALENVQFERENVANSTVAARIRLVLYLEQAS